MTAIAARVRANLRTTVGTQDLTSSRLGSEEAEGYVLLITKADTVNTDTAHAWLSTGYSDGTTHAVSGGGSEDGQDTTDVTRFQNDDAVGKVYDVGGTTLEVEVEHDSMIAGGVRIDVTTTDGSDYLVECWLFGGSDVSAQAFSQGLGNSTGDQAVSLSFEADLVFSTLGITNGGVAGQDWEQSWGVVHNDGAGGVTQRVAMIRERNGRNTSSNGIHVRDDSGAGELLNNTTPDWWGVYEDFTGSGFNINVQNAGANSRTIKGLAISFGGVVDAAVWTLSTPTSTGLATDGGPNFEPQLYGYILHQAADTIGQNGATVGLSAADADGAGTASVAMEDSAGTSNAQSRVEDKPVYLADDDGGADLVASHSSMEATGPRMNWTTVHGSARTIWGWAVEAEAGGGTTLEGELTLARDAGISQDGTAQAVASVTLARDVGLARAASAQAVGQLTLARTDAQVQAAVATAVSALTLARDVAITLDGITVQTALLTLSKDLAQASSAQAASVASLALSKDLAASQDALATAVASLILSKASNIAQEGSAAALGSLSMDKELGDAYTGRIAIQAYLSLARDLGISQDAQASAAAAITLARDAGQTQAAVAAAAASLSLDVDLAVSWAGTIIGGGETVAAFLTLARQADLNEAASAQASGQLSLGLDLGTDWAAVAAAVADLQLGRQADLSQAGAASAAAALTLAAGRAIALSTGLPFPAIIPGGRLVIIEEERVWLYAQDANGERWISVPFDDNLIT